MSEVGIVDAHTFNLGEGESLIDDGSDLSSVELEGGVLIQIGLILHRSGVKKVSPHLLSRALVQVRIVDDRAERPFHRDGLFGGNEDESLMGLQQTFERLRQLDERVDE